ncbi:MAG TPA: Uma2 family endonuclease [Thermoanaerobaculia bacterium]|nr:Uma2 family endonuclease [Thermoanaerobaculia bacterium]
MAVSAVNVHRWMREEYERAAAAGCFAPAGRVELIEGIVYDMSPRSSRHSAVVRLVEKALNRIGTGWDVRGQMPLALGADSEPEPDVAVVAGSPRDYLLRHPTAAVLIVEVADASLAHGRKRKAPLYARAGIAECWIIDLTAEALEVYREPSPEGYRSHAALRAGDSLTPLHGTRAIAVADLLP